MKPNKRSTSSGVCKTHTYSKYLQVRNFAVICCRIFFHLRNAVLGMSSHMISFGFCGNLF